MVKRLLIFLVIIIAIPLINAGSIGITPTSFKYFFEPNMEKTFNFKVYTDNQNKTIEFYVNGDLSKYVTLDKNYSIGDGGFEVVLKLPEKIDIPGNHRIIIGAIESVSNKSGGMGVGGVAAVQAPIDIFVPYPGKYAEASFEISDINKGEKSPYKLEINNLGSEVIDPQVTLRVYGELDKKTEIISETINTGEIKSKDKIQIDGYLDTENFSYGFYPVVLSIDYNKSIQIEKVLRIGIFSINVSDYSYQFESGRINKFLIDVESLWNSRMKNVYSEISISKNGIIFDSFKTSSVELEPWEKINLTGFFDATNVSEGKYIANIMLFYENETSGKLVTIYVKNPLEKINPFLIAFIFAGVLVLLCIILIICLIIKIKRMKNGKIKKK